MCGELLLLWNFNSLNFNDFEKVKSVENPIQTMVKSMEKKPIEKISPASLGSINYNMTELKVSI